MNSVDLPNTLRRLADFADIGGVSFEAADLRRIAAELEERPEEVAQLSRLARGAHPGGPAEIPSRLHPRVREILIEGPDRVTGAAWSALPWLHRRLLDTESVDSAGAAALAREGIVTFDDLAAFLHERATGPLAGHHSRLREAHDLLVGQRPRLTLGRAVELLEHLSLLLTTHCPSLDACTPAGDVRRVEPLVCALALVGHTPDPMAALARIGQLTPLRLLHCTGRRALVAFQQSEVDLRIVAPDEYGTALHAATGSPAHVAAMRARQPTTRLSAREADVYAHAGLPWIPAEIRHNTGEIEAAAEGRLPVLVDRAEIRGDLHLHTTYSDGRDSVAAMVQMAATIGYEYVAITDHSERAGAPRTLTREALARQRDEIETLRERFPGLTILHGAEVDIMADGSLDFDDTILESLDIVLASLHVGRGHDPARLTRRCVAAIEHPLVNVITHPANRLVGHNDGYALDFPTIFARAAETGTALEIDGAPSHLDLDGERAREAVAAGVTVVIDSDCHKAALLERQMRLGVGTARRGWVEARHVLNTRSIEEVKTFLRAKRRPQR